MRRGDRPREGSLAAHLAAAFLNGAVSGASWNARSRRTARQAEVLVDWPRVRQVAHVVARRTGAARLDQPTRQAWEAEYRDIIARVSPPLLRYLGPGANPAFHFETAPEVVGRLEWIDVNLATFRGMFQPVEVLAAERLRGHISQPLNQQASSLMLGLVLGYLSGRVLGQYDPSLLVSEVLPPGKLLLLQPNLEAAQHDLGVPARQFFTWIVFHELTHSWQFEAHPWLRTYMSSQVSQLLASTSGRLIETDAAELLRLAMRGDISLRQPQRLAAALMTADQLDTFNRLQAVMCLVEGFSNHVMDVLGPETLPDYAHISGAFEGRDKRRGSAEKLFVRLTGLELKMEQYKAGERFVDAVVAARGIAIMNRAWEGPANLPDLREIYQPQLWLDRVAGSST